MKTKKKDKKMETRKKAKKTVYIGAGAGFLKGRKGSRS